MGTSQSPGPREGMLWSAVRAVSCSGGWSHSRAALDTGTGPWGRSHRSVARGHGDGATGPVPQSCCTGPWGWGHGARPTDMLHWATGMGPQGPFHRYAALGHMDGAMGTVPQSCCTGHGDGAMDLVPQICYPGTRGQGHVAGPTDMLHWAKGTGPWGWSAHLCWAWRGGRRGQTKLLMSLVNSESWEISHPMKDGALLWGWCWPLSSDAWWSLRAVCAQHSNPVATHLPARPPSLVPHLPGCRPEPHLPTPASP